MGYNIRFENSNYLCHKSHKYIDKKWSNGRWNYIYEEAKNAVGKALGADKKAELYNAKMNASVAQRNAYEKTQDYIYSHNAHAQAERIDRAHGHLGQRNGTVLRHRVVGFQKMVDQHKANVAADQAGDRLEAAQKAYDKTVMAKAEKAAKSMEKAVSKGKDIANKILALPFMAAFVIGYTHNKNHNHN